MAELSFLLEVPRTPLEALQAAVLGRATLLAEHVAFEQFDCPDLLDGDDEAWRWHLLEGAPRFSESAGIQVISDASGRLHEATGEQRRRLTRGVVVNLAAQGGYIVAIDTGENESDSALVEYAMGMVGR